MSRPGVANHAVIPLSYFMLFFLCVLALGGGGVLYYQDQRDIYRRQAESELRAVSDAKLSLISQWVTERSGDLQVVTAPPMLDLIEKAVAEPKDPAVQTALTQFGQAISEGYHYSNFVVLNSAGQVVFSLAADTEHLVSAIERYRSQLLKQSGIVVTQPLYLPNGDVRIAFLRAAGPPESGGDHRPICAFEFDPRSFWRSSIQDWPRPSRSAEVLIVAREGSRVVFQSDLRYRQGASYDFALPLDDTSSPAVMAVRGVEGLVRGIDYRGVPVLAYLRKVPETPWFLVAKIDAEEVDEVVRANAWKTGGVVSLLLLALGTTLAMIWRHQREKDVRRLYESELRLKRSQVILEKLQDSGVIAIAHAEPDRIIDATDSFLALIGYSKEDLATGALNWKALVEGGSDGSDDPFTPGIEKVALHEIRLRKKDGTLVPVLFGGAVVRTAPNPLCALLVADLSSRKTAESALKERGRMLALAAQMAQIGYFEVRGDPQKLAWSDELYRIFGMSRESFVPTLENIHDFVHPDDRGRDQDLARQISDAEPVLEGEFRIVRPDGDIRTARYKLEVEPGYDGRAAHVFGVVQDVTEAKHLEEQWLEAKKMEAVGRLAGGIAHGFNNLLTIIFGFTELTLRKLGEDDPLRKGVEQIRKAAQRASSLTSQLLVFGRKELFSPRSVEMNEIVQESEGLLRYLLPENVHLEVVPSETPLWLKADRERLIQALVELGTNARDVLSGGGDIAIRVAQVEVDAARASRSPALKPGSYVAVSVADNGPGMDDETRSKIFEPFFTVRRRTGIDGLGLPLVQSIVAQCGGVISVESRPGKGTEFEILLPTSSPEPAAEEAPRNLEQEASASWTILLVDDEEAIRALVYEVLTSRGFRVLTAPDGEAALRVASEEKGRIDVLVTDVVMPKVNGRQLAEFLRRSRPDLRVVYMSGFTDDVIQQQGVIGAGDSYLQKPFSGERLIAALEQRGQEKAGAMILVVDDEEAIRVFFSGVLSEAGYRVVQAADGEEALEKVCENKLDLVLTDLVMPEREGMETIDLLRRSYPELKIVAVSGAFGGGFLPTARALGARAVLAKPVSPDVLLDTVARVLSE